MSDRTVARTKSAGGSALEAWASSPRFWVIGFVAILMLAFAVRLINLNNSLWYDEIFTLTHFVRLPFDKLLSTYSSLNNHPLYSLEAKTVISMVGESSAALRFPSVLAGVGSIALAGVLTRRFTSPATALLVCLLLALAYHHVWFSQNARGYTSLLFWSTAASLLFLKGAHDPNRWTWPLYGVTFAAAHYTHLSAAFFFAGHGLLYAFALARRLLGGESPSPLNGVKPFYGMLVGAVLTLLLYAPMLPTIGSTFEKTRETPELDPLASWTDPGFVIDSMVDQISGLGPLMGIALLIAVIMGAIGAYVVWKKSPLIVAIFLLPIPITIFVLSLAGMRIWPRYFFIEIQFLYMCGVLGAMTIVAVATKRVPVLRDRVPAGILPIVAGIAMIGVSLVMLEKNFRYPKQDLEGAVAYVQQMAEPGDVRAAYGLASESLTSYMVQDWSTPEDPAALNQLASGSKPAWVVVAFIDQVQAGDPVAWAVLEQRYDRVTILPGSMGDGDVFVFRSRAR